MGNNISSAENGKLYVQEWLVQNPKAWLILVHGLGEHIGRYQHVAEYFNEQQYSVIGYDHIGHGRSEGKRGVVMKYDTLLDDLNSIVELTKLKANQIPVFIYAHSLGGNIALNYLLKRKPKIAGMITSGAAIKLSFEPNPFVVALGKITRSIYPSFSQNNQLDVNHISRNKAVVEAYKKDNLVHDKIGAELGISILETCKWLQNYKGASPIPLLLMHGGDDKLTHPSGTEAFSKQISGDVTLKIWHRLYHELHNEPEQNEVLDYVMMWMKERVG